MTTLAAQTIGTTRLDLLPLVVEHAEEMSAVLADPALHAFTGIAHIHPEHRASAAVATAAGLTPTTEWHDGEIQWRRSIGR